MDKNVSPQIIDRIKKSGGFCTSFYGIGDRRNKLVFLWSPRAGCSITCKQAFNLLGLLKDVEDYDNFVHNYRIRVYKYHAPYIDILKLPSDYTIIKTIVNPYSRAVSIWWKTTTSQDWTFREFMRRLVNGETDELTKCEKFHLRPQYIKGEEEYITKYIKLESGEKFPFKLANGRNYKIDFSRYTSVHHGNRVETEYFVGDVKNSEIQSILPKNYKFFYDPEIKSLVEDYFRDDIEHYGYTYQELRSR